ncbi:acyltransferase family protein [Serratia marcescens]|uniref:acyltransferase family protein n=1 Tax=Serratia marcescens TaxID=615 RepID=UPI003FA76C4E
MSSYFPAANGTRGLAVIIVLITHGIVMFFNKTQPLLAGTGKIGVWLFFVLSAFLLTTKFIDSGLTKDSFFKYLASRFFRIIPIFIISAIFYYLAGYYDSEALFNIVTMQDGFAHLWTIPVEFKFYFILPILFLVFNFTNDKFGLIGVITITLLLIISLQFVFPYWGVKENSIVTSWYIPCFAFGVLASFVIKKEKCFIPRTMLILLGLTPLLAIAITIPAIQHFIFGSQIKTPLGDKYIYIGFLWAVFICITFNTQSIISEFLSSKMMSFLGRNSFSIYLFHWYVLTEISNIKPESITWMLTSIGISIAAGYAIYLIIENPIEKFRHSIINGITKKSEEV